MIRIGTRSSALALFQANKVKEELKKLHIKSEIIPINSTGDINLIQPLYEMNITGVFTKELDIALLNKQIDIAVHSLKDVPTLLPKTLQITSYLERDFPEDVLVRNSKSNKKGFSNLNILTGSLRRKAFWNAKFKNISFGEIRGNVQTRLQKLEDSDADGTIFSLAGLKRMNMDIEYEILDFMIPAPAQGVICCMSRESDTELNGILQKINHKQTQKCVEIERNILSILEGGCSAPIGCYAEINNTKLKLKVQVSSIDGTKTAFLNDYYPLETFTPHQITKKILEQGGKEILNEIKK